MNAKIAQLFLHTSTLFILLSFQSRSLETDTISHGVVMKDPDTIISDKQVFKLGFFTPDNTTNRYLGIFYAFSEKTVIWVANRDNPLKDSTGAVTISGDGNLVLTNGKNQTLWSTNATTSSPTNTAVQILDTGNLVLRDNATRSTVWECFEHPTDVFMRTMKISHNIYTAMDFNTVKVVYHSGGMWVRDHSLRYINGKTTEETGDMDYLSVTHMLKMYEEKLKMPNLTKLCYLKPGKKLGDDDVMILENDGGINDLVAAIIDLNLDCSVQIFPFDEIVVKHSHIGTQYSQTMTGDMSYEKVVKDMTNMADLEFLSVVGFDAGGSDYGADKVYYDAGGSDYFDTWGSYGANDFEAGGSGVGGEKRFDAGGSGVGGEKRFDAGGSGLGIDKGYDTEGSGSGADDINESDIESVLDSLDDESDSEGEYDETVEFSLISQSRKLVKYDVDDGNPHFLLGMTFADAKEARMAISKYSIAKCTPLKLNPNEKERIRAKCQSPGCPFLLFMSQSGNTPNLVVKTFNSQHDCLRDSKNRFATKRFIANELRGVINETPNITTKELMKIIENKLHLYVSKSTCKRAKRLVKNELDGSYLHEFGYLSAHLEMLKETNPGTTTVIEFRDEPLEAGRRVFKRLYVCFHALKMGWLGGCRPIIGIDGCHLKGVVKGQVLVAVGKDAAEHMFPIAWAVTERENTENWKWFLELLVKDLNISDRGSSLTIISDMQKGLLNAVGDVLPLVEHRFCARHVHANWAKKWHSGELHKWFWICAWSTFRAEFDDNLKHLGSISRKAAEDFVAYNPQRFCRAFISSRCKSDIVVNNFCEAFNASIKNARFKPIVSMLNEIRECAMERMASQRAAVEKCQNNWSITCMTTFQDHNNRAFGCKVLFNGEDGYEVFDKVQNVKHLVRMNAQECSCRVWQLTGIPCTHAICAINHSRQDPKTFISPWYEKSAAMATYKYAMQIVPDIKFMNVDAFPKCEPPPYVRQTGRPRVKRIRSVRESMKGKSFGSLGRKGLRMTCSRCHEGGHNRAKCPQIQKDKDQVQGSTTSLATDKVQQSRKGKEKVTASSAKYSTRRMVGMGIFIDETSGNTTLNPGMRGEVIVTQHVANKKLSSNPDPVIRYPIPNERVLRQELEASRPNETYTSRKIAIAEPSVHQSSLPANLPFKPPGPTWNGKPCITRRQLEKERDNKKAKKQ